MGLNVPEIVPVSARRLREASARAPLRL